MTRVRNLAVMASLVPTVVYLAWGPIQMMTESHIKADPDYRSEMVACRSVRAMNVEECQDEVDFRYGIAPSE